MGSIYNRGTRDRPRWYVTFKNESGRRRAVNSRQPTKVQARKFLERIEARIADGMVGIESPENVPLCSGLLETWADSLTNRNARDDGNRMRRHVLPVFGDRRINQVDLRTVMRWIDDQRAAGKLSEASMRHNLNLLSRFFSWAIERGHTEVNPVRQIPSGKRPQQSQKTDVPWLNDDIIVRKLIAALPEPVSYMFYLGNRSGLRTGECAGVRMSDFGFLDEGVIRVRYSYDGPLKEDKKGTGKVKWCPAADDSRDFLGPWLDNREASGAGPEDLVFPGPRFLDRPCRKEYIESVWERAVRKHGDKEPAVELDLTWYQATRHSFVSRLLEAGASLDEVSAAVGHSSPVVTKRYYDHYIRRTFSAELRTGLGLGGKGEGKVIPMRPKKRPWKRSQATKKSPSTGAKKNSGTNDQE